MGDASKDDVRVANRDRADARDGESADAGDHHSGEATPVRAEGNDDAGNPEIDQDDLDDEADDVVDTSGNERAPQARGPVDPSGGAAGAKAPPGPAGARPAGAEVPAGASGTRGEAGPAKRSQGR